MHCPSHELGKCPNITHTKDIFLKHQSNIQPHLITGRTSTDLKRMTKNRLFLV